MTALPPPDNFDDFDDLPHRPWPWPLRLCVAVLRVSGGLFVALVALSCLAVMLLKLLVDHDKTNVLIGALIVGAVSLWVVTLGLRLIFNRRDHGGLLPPWFLRLFAVYLVAFPIFLLVTGRDAGWPWWRYLHVALAIAAGASYWGLAAYRKASHLRA